MPIYRCGSSLHGTNAFSLCTMNGRTLISSNTIASHPVYRLRVNASDTYNAEHVAMLAEYIINALRNHASENTVRKLNGMIQNIYNMRNNAQKGYKANYYRKFANIKATLTRLRAERRNREARNLSTRNINRQISNAEAAFTANTNQWVRHQDQIKYWRWVRNIVLPEAKKGIRNLK